MSTETQEKIAKILGYSRNLLVWYNPDKIEIESLPDWENDLNASHELWEFMVSQPDKAHDDYWNELIKPGELDEPHICILIMLKTPREHCLAFLKAMEST
jgi:hypothetical protein